jgi:FkbM family methyltransferase
MSFLEIAGAPIRWTFLPGFLRASYALLLKRASKLTGKTVVTDIPGIGKMQLEPWDFIDSRLLFFQTWEPAITRFMQKEILPGSVTIDIGANIGYFSLLMSRAVGPDGHVFAVEPSPDIRARLQDAIDRNGITNVTIVPYGVSDKAERRSFQLSMDNKGASKFGEVSEDGLELRRLQDIVPPEMFARVSLIKIDVEGMEAQVMRDLLPMIPQLPQHVSICSELRIDDEMIEIIEQFKVHDMDTLHLPNLYSMYDYPAHPTEPERLVDLPKTQLDVAFVRR